MSTLLDCDVSSEGENIKDVEDDPAAHETPVQKRAQTEDSPQK